jgi:hypothetical protein
MLTLWRIHRENSARTKSAASRRLGWDSVPEIVFSAWVDPTGWLGRQYTDYERMLMMGPIRKCRAFTRATIGGNVFRTTIGDRGKHASLSFIRALFPADTRDANDRPEWVDRCDHDNYLPASTFL